MSKLLFFSDVHVSDKPPRNRSDSYSDDIFNKLFYISSYVKMDTSIEAILIGGDLFHNPIANRVSHHLVGRWFDWLDTLNVPCVIVPGNHDLNNIISIKKQPIGLLKKHSNVIMLYEGATWTTPFGVVQINLKLLCII